MAIETLTIITIKWIQETIIISNSSIPTPNKETILSNSTTNHSRNIKAATIKCIRNNSTCADTKMELVKCNGTTIIIINIVEIIIIIIIWMVDLITFISNNRSRSQLINKVLPSLILTISTKHCNKLSQRARVILFNQLKSNSKHSFIQISYRWSWETKMCSRER